MKKDIDRLWRTWVELIEAVLEENDFYTTTKQITPENLRSRLSKLKEDLDLEESIDLLAFLLDGVWEALLKRKNQIKGGSKDEKEGILSH